jgi:hypothetical protein
MWGCLIAAAITFPLVWGWIHFETAPGDLSLYRAFVFGFPVMDFPLDSPLAFVIFHGLVWASFLVIAGVMLAFRRRMIDHGAVAVQRFGQDVLPLVLLFAISITGLMLTASYTDAGYAYDFILHAVVAVHPVVATLQAVSRVPPAQLGELLQGCGANDTKTGVAGDAAISLAHGPRPRDCVDEPASREMAHDAHYRDPPRAAARSAPHRDE